MLTKTKVALSLAVLLGTVSFALAATKSHHHAAMASHSMAAGYQSYDYSWRAGQSARTRNEPAGGLIQDRDFLQSNGTAPEKIW